MFDIDGKIGQCIVAARQAVVMSQRDLAAETG